MTEIKLEYKDQQVRTALNKLLRAGTDLSPVMREIAGHLTDSAEDSFERETAPDGTPWAKLSETTKSRRQKSGHVPIKILRQNGDLKRSIVADWDKTSAIVGTINAYATTHQFGAKRGEFGTGPKGQQYPWGDIPARPFLGISPEQDRQIQEAVLTFAASQWT